MNAEVNLTNVILETDRLILRSWKKDDANDLYEYAKVDGVGQMAGWDPHASIKESEMIIESFIEEMHVFAIELKENHKVIGSVGLEELSLSVSEYYDNAIGREIGYVLSKDYWGKGIMPEAVKRVIKFCFEEEKYDYLLCSHAYFNNQSKRVIEKCGFHFVKECERTTINGTRRNSFYYVLDNE